MIDYPLAKYNFEVEMDGFTRIGFTEVSGLDMENEVIEYREGAFTSPSKIVMPGMFKYSTISFKRGMVRGDNDIHDWFQTILDPANRRDIQVTLLDEVREPVFVWVISNAFVTKCSSTDLKAEGNEIAIETMEVRGDSISVSVP
ncbi:phage tail protein [Tateyamaria sp. syn59]|uniref:phage tail protein n=1 Tax=Tateyamaria sp. syn59 TaxID=2576942 RepID=UPI001CB8DC52|nr:phage tail protein [Tateyamaria sp. syn59]